MKSPKMPMSPKPKGAAKGKHGDSKPHLRARKLSSTGKSAYANPGGAAAMAFPPGPPGGDAGAPAFPPAPGGGAGGPPPDAAPGGGMPGM